MLYLAFDHLLRNEIDVSRLPGIPLGYNDFTTIFNKGNHPHDNRKLSTFIPGTSGQPDYVNKSTSPIYLQDFYITPEQCRLSSPQDSGILDMQALILEDYATSQALKNKRHHDFYNKWQTQNDHTALFGRFGSAKNRDHHVDPIGTTTRQPFSDTSSTELFTAGPSSSTNPASTSNIITHPKPSKKSEKSCACDDMQE